MSVNADTPKRLTHPVWTWPNQGTEVSHAGFFWHSQLVRHLIQGSGADPGSGQGGARTHGDPPWRSGENGRDAWRTHSEQASWQVSVCTHRYKGSTPRILFLNRRAQVWPRFPLKRASGAAELQLPNTDMAQIRIWPKYGYDPGD